jgi:hypothetical protein
VELPTRSTARKSDFSSEIFSALSYLIPKGVMQGAKQITLAVFYFDFGVVREDKNQCQKCNQ